MKKAAKCFTHLLFVRWRVISYQASDDLTKAQSGVGHPVKVDIKIVASDGAEVPHGVCGEILVTGAHCASGYYNDDICQQG